MASIGEQLKQIREDQNKSLEDAANATKISKRYLVAVEEGNYGLIPGQTYVVGIIRNYARYLGIDPKPMVEQYSKLILPDDDDIRTNAMTRVDQMPRVNHKNTQRRMVRKRVGILLLIIVFLILCLAGLVWWYGRQ